MDGDVLKSFLRNKKYQMKNLWQQNKYISTYEFWKYFWRFLKNNNPYIWVKYFFNKKNFMKQNLEKVKIYDGLFDIDIYIIAFNKPELITKQMYFLKKNLKDNYRLIIADNSNNESSAKQIESICEINKISYIRLPKNKLNASHSHGLSLNYLMSHIISKSKTKYIWFIDHDCWLIKKFSIVNILEKQPFWWLLIDNIPVKIFNNYYNFAWNRWFVWPWCAFYRKELFSQWYNFLPVKRLIPISFLDTWWWNRKHVYKFYNKQDMCLLNRYKDDKMYWVENLWNTFIHLWGAWYRNKIEIENIMNKVYDKYI